MISPASRSCKISAQYIQEVKKAVQKRGFPSQSALALDLELTRTTVSRFLNGNPVDFRNFKEISEKLGFDWQVIADKDPEINDIETDRFYLLPPIFQECCNEILKLGSLLRIEAPKKMGKSSLMGELAKFSQKQGYRVVFLNLRLAEIKDFENLQDFLRWFCLMIAQKLDLSPNVDEHWNKQVGNNMIKCQTYFEKYLLRGEKPLALLLDDIDKVFPYSDIAKDFFSLLRTCHEEAKISDIWKQLRVVLAYTEPYSKIELRQSPFNAGKEMRLPELTQEQIQDLSQRYDLNLEINQINQLMNIIGGHPDLIRKTFESFLPSDNSLNEIFFTEEVELEIYHEHLQQHWEILRSNPELIEPLKKVIFSDSPMDLYTTFDIEAIQKLKNLGLIKIQKNKASPRYELYRQYFCKRLG